MDGDVAIVILATKGPVAVRFAADHQSVALDRDGEPFDRLGIALRADRIGIADRHGDIVRADGAPNNGMVMDFADVKAIAKEHVVDVWDHAFLAYRHDTAVVGFLQSMPGHKTVILDVVPTAENLAAEAFRILDPLYRDVYGNHLRLERIRQCEVGPMDGEVCARPVVPRHGQ